MSGLSIYSNYNTAVGDGAMQYATAGFNAAFGYGALRSGGGEINTALGMNVAIIQAVLGIVQLDIILEMIVQEDLKTVSQVVRW